MAKRRRKMTLFDVIDRGQPIGLSVRNRTPAHLPTPELPVTKKLAKLFGRKPAGSDADRPLSAADELARLRQELSGSEPVETRGEAGKPRIADAEATRDEGHAEAVAPLSAAERARRQFQVDDEPAAAPQKAVRQPKAAREPEPAREPREPRRPIGAVVGEAARARWAAAAPHVRAFNAKAADLGGRGLVFARDGLGHAAGAARDFNSRHAVTTLAAAAVVVLLGGSFYAGKLLFNRPAAELAAATSDGLTDGDVRPDVLDVGTRANEPVANVDAPPTKVAVERTPRPADARVFGGRRVDINYLIIQKYDTQAEADAAVEVLNKYGVKTTVETTLPRWSKPGRPGFYVVSLDGFAKMGGNPQYAAFVAQLAKISDKEAGATLPRRLDPLPYRYAPQQP